MFVGVIAPWVATAELAALAGLEPSYYEGPTGIVGVVADALGRAAMADPASEYIAFVEPGNVITRRVGLRIRRFWEPHHVARSI